MNLTNIYSFGLIIIFAPLIGELIKCCYDFYKLTNQYKKGSRLLDLLNRITPREFEIWASEYLSSIGFNNVVLSPLSQNENKCIICIKNTKTFFIQCKRKNYNAPINKTDIEELLGSLISNNQHNGILVTTNSISEDVAMYIKEIKQPYSIEIISFYNESTYYKDYILQP